MLKALRRGFIYVVVVLAVGMLGAQVLRWTALNDRYEALLALAASRQAAGGNDAGLLGNWTPRADPVFGVAF